MNYEVVRKSESKRWEGVEPRRVPGDQSYFHFSWLARTLLDGTLPMQNCAALEGCSLRS
jgi:hypothetical protein